LVCALKDGMIVLNTTCNRVKKDFYFSIRAFGLFHHHLLIALSSLLSTVKQTAITSFVYFAAYISIPLPQIMSAIRRSDETERTRVPTRVNSTQNLDALQKESGLATIPSQNIPDSEHLETPRRSSSIDLEKDMEKADSDDESGNNDEREEMERENPEHLNVEEKDPNLISWNGPDDPENPMNWARGWKWLYTVVLGMMTFCITFASSVFSTATVVTAKLFGVSLEVMTLGTSFFVLGFAVGPLVWGPMSELFGRKKPLFIGFFIFAIFQIATAVAQNLYTIMLTRFFGGVFGSAPLAVVGGALVDFFNPVDRGVAACIFAGATFVGPVAGPIIGGFVTQSYLGWRWTAYITAIMGFFFGAIGFLIIPESHAPTILSARAKKIRYETKNWAIHAKADESQVDIHNIVHIYLLRPFEMLVREPILLLVSLYLALVYGILYLFFEAYPISFQQGRGWNDGVGALPFISILIGVIFAAITITIVTKTRFARKFKKHGRVIPEERLPPMILGAFILPIGLFWFAWTSSPEITWVPQVIAGIPIGWGMLL
jgi:MFS transporter, DHA1 family, multidrug resistance protein